MSIQRFRYGTNWPALARAKKEAAGWRCEWCDRPCRRPGESWADHGTRAIADGWLLELHKRGRFVLTVAHLDQNPANDSPSNHAALCAPCHLACDRPHVRANRAAKRERAGQGNLFHVPAGRGRDPRHVQLHLL